MVSIDEKHGMDTESELITFIESLCNQLAAYEKLLPDLQYIAKFKTPKNVDQNMLGCNNLADIMKGKKFIVTIQ
jgi:hypothetical protein